MVYTPDTLAEATPETRRLLRQAKEEDICVVIDEMLYSRYCSDPNRNSYCISHFSIEDRLERTLRPYVDSVDIGQIILFRYSPSWDIEATLNEDGTPQWRFTRPSH